MQSLIDSIKTTVGKKKVEELAAIASEEFYSVKDLIDLSFHQNQQIGFRAAWILENVFSSDQKRFLTHCSYFLDRLSSQTNLSALRHYVKIIAYLTKKNASAEIKEIIESYHTEPIVEAVFVWLIDEKIPVAVKSHCLNILANLYLKHPWIKEDLSQTIDFLVDKESVGFFSKVKYIRKQLSAYG